MSIATAIESAQGKVAAAYTACNNKGATMPASANQNLSNLATTIGTIPTGGGSPNLTTLSVTPTTSAQEITPTAPVDGYNKVNVSAVSASIDNNISAGNIKKDVTILGVTGTYEGSGGGGGGSTTYKVYWFDYDGTVLKEDTVAEGGSSTAPTTMPTHQYLTFQEWVHGNTITNVTQDYFNIARYSSTYDYVVRKVNIGADQSYRLRIGNQKVNNDPVIVDWGDGTTDTFTSSTNFKAEHVYATAFSGYVLVYSTTAKNITTLRLDGTVGEYGVEEYYFGAKTVISDCAYLGVANPKIKAVVLPNGLTQLRRGLFSNFSAKVLAVPPTVTSFEAQLCVGYRPHESTLMAINVPTNTTTFGGDMFLNLQSLKFITKDLYLTSIGTSAFADTSIGGELTFKSSVTSFGGGAFWKAAKLRKITIASGTFTSLAVASGRAFFTECPELEEIVLPSTLPITTIGDSAFAYSTKLKTITNFPKNATTIGQLVFRNCYSLETPIEFTNVTSMGRGVFGACYKIQSVKLGGTFTSLGVNQVGFFADCRSLTSVQLPNTITQFDNNTFSGCWSLQTLTLPTSLTKIGNYTFSNCGLVELTLPETAITIGTYFMQNSYYLKSIYFGINTTISNNAGLFTNAIGLMEIDCAQGWRPTVDLPLSASMYLYPDMLETFFTHLGDNTGYTARKITIGTTNLNRLSAAQKAIATGKNYTLA